jgi:hypothetical protein
MKAKTNNGLLYENRVRKSIREAASHYKNFSVVPEKSAGFNAHTADLKMNIKSKK